MTTISQALRRIATLKGEIAKQRERLQRSTVWEGDNAPTFDYATTSEKLLKAKHTTCCRRSRVTSAWWTSIRGMARTHCRTARTKKSGRNSKQSGIGARPQWEVGTTDE